METKLFNSYSVVPFSILAFFIGIGILIGINGYVNKDYYSKKGDAIIACINQGMVYDMGDCIPYKKN